MNDIIQTFSLTHLLKRVSKATHPTPLESVVPSGRRSMYLHAPVRLALCVFGVMDVDVLISDYNWPQSSWMKWTVEDGSLWNMTDDSMWSWPCEMLHLDLFIISHSVWRSIVAFCSVPLVFTLSFSLPFSFWVMRILANPCWEAVFSPTADCSKLYNRKIGCVCFFNTDFCGFTKHFSSEDCFSITR